MRSTIDRAGRLVIPKPLREAIGMGEGGEIDIELSDGTLVLAPPEVAMRIEDRDGRPTIVTDETVLPLRDDVVREVRDAVRR